MEGEHQSPPTIVYDHQLWFKFGLKLTLTCEALYTQHNTCRQELVHQQTKGAAFQGFIIHMRRALKVSSPTSTTQLSAFRASCALTKCHIELEAFKYRVPPPLAQLYGVKGGQHLSKLM